MPNETDPLQNRRAFLEKAGKAALTAPAAALLLASAGRSAMAAPYGKRHHHPDPDTGPENPLAELLQWLLGLL